MKHELKIEPPEFSRVLDGSKTFLQQRERLGFQKGDTVLLREYDETPQNSTSSAPKGYTESPPIEFLIGYVESNGSTAILSLLPLPGSEDTFADFVQSKATAPKPAKARKG